DAYGIASQPYEPLAWRSKSEMSKIVKVIVEPLITDSRFQQIVETEEKRYRSGRLVKAGAIAVTGGLAVDGWRRNLTGQLGPVDMVLTPVGMIGGTLSLALLLGHEAIRQSSKPRTTEKEWGFFVDKTTDALEGRNR
ncbi:MAG: hypothetical protein Q8O19_06620, partial [Rectinemataceae bacterium]|nr:hypothetical protein [Rectinemataceae bacterium]